MNYKWKIKPTNFDKINNFCKEKNYPKHISTILINKNLISDKEIDLFLHPTLDKLHDPYLMKDMQIAVDRLKQAIKNNENVMIYGDYDVDGTTSTSLLYLVLKEFGLEEPIYYIPNREREGYGISISGINNALQKNIDLIITCDCGINAFEQIEYANRNNIDVIVTDHHEAPEKLPNARAVLNPKRKDDSYPFKELCGAGVAFKLLHGFILQSDYDIDMLYKHLDLVSIGTAADIVPLIDENRILTSVGLKKIETTLKPGIKSLLEISNFGKNKTFQVSNIVFGVAPRINAAGRLSEASHAVNLLTTDNPKEAGMLAQSLDKINRERRNIEKKTFDAAILQFNRTHNLNNDKIIILYGKDWHQGVIGIVASKMKEIYNRPVIMISISNGIGKGSGRSITGFDLHATLFECSDLLSNFGGHVMAAGLTIDERKIPELIGRIRKIAENKITEEMLLPELKIECEVSFQDINQETIEFLKLLSPFGPANMRPMFITKNVLISGLPRIIGENHLKFKASQNRIVISAIGWKLGSMYEMLISRRPLDLAFVIEENEYRGLKEVQLNIKDIKYSK